MLSGDAGLIVRLNPRCVVVGGQGLELSTAGSLEMSSSRVIRVYGVKVNRMFME